MRTAVITGASSGLGLLIANRMKEWCDKVIDWSLPSIDLTLEKHIVAAASQLPKHIDIVVNCAGANHLEFIPKMTAIDFDKVMAVNARAIFLTAKHLADRMKYGTICNIISNASHVPMTHSIAYNASKAAAEMMTRQMAKELWSTHGIVVFGVSPNKLWGDSEMNDYVLQRSAELRGVQLWEAQEYQKSKMLLGMETDPNCVAEFVDWLLSENRRHTYLAGSIMEYGI